MDSLSGVTMCYIVEHGSALIVVGDVDWSESGKLLGDLHLDLFLLLSGWVMVQLCVFRYGLVLHAL